MKGIRDTTVVPGLQGTASHSGDDDDVSQTRRLRRSEALVRNSNEVVSILALDGTITYVSPSAERIFGYSPTEMAGAIGFDFIHAEDRAVAMAAVERAGAEGVAAETMRARHADGSWRWIEQTMVNHVHDPSVAGIVITTRDVTDRKLAEERLGSLNRLYAMVSTTNQAIIRATDPPAFLNAVCAIAVEHGGFCSAWIGMVDHASGVVHAVAARRAGLASHAPLGRTVAISDHPAIRVGAQDGTPVFADNMADDERMRSFREDRLADGATSLAVFPLVVAGTVAAILILGSETLGYWEGEQQTVGAQLARDVSFGLQTLDESRRRRTAEDEATIRVRQQSAVSALGITALESRDRPGFLSVAVASVMATLDAANAAIVEPGSEDGFLRIAATDEDRDGVCVGDVLPSETLAMTAYALRTGEAVLVDDRRSDPRFGESHFSWARDYASGITVLIAAKGHCYGALTVHHSRPKFFTVDDQRFLETVAHIVAGVHERARYEEAIGHRALHDAATELPNRALFRERLSQAIARKGRTNVNSAVFCVDVNGFKLINDSLGHANGDLVLVEMARRILSYAGESDTVARFIGDQFAILFDDIETIEHAPRVAQGLLARMAEPFLVDGREVALTASIGIALVATGVSADDVLRDATVAMHRAKTMGRGRYEMADATLHDRAVQRLEMEEGLRHAIARGELRVHYQPVIDLADNVVLAIEALVRWEHPSRGLIGPAEFIALAEETGLIIPMGRWVLEEACRTVAEWNRRRDKPLGLAVNLSTRQLSEPDPAAMVSGILGRTGLAPGCLSLEITESRLMEDAVASAEVLAELHALGVRLTVDDFGTGYSSLLYLRRFPVDTLKVDRAFVSGLDTHAEDTAIVRAVIALGHSLGMQVVAEGVETMEQMVSLRLLGCDLAQGFLWSRPVPGAKLEWMLDLAAEGSE